MNAVAPTMLSSSKMPQPEFACWCPSRPCDARSAAYSPRFSPFMIRCCQSMFTFTFVIPRARRVDHVQRHPDVAHEDLHRRLGVLVLEEEQPALRRETLRDLADPVDQASPHLGVRHLERIVVALAAGPDDHLRLDLAGEIRRLEQDPERLGAHAVVEVREAALLEALVDVQPAGDRVDPVALEGRSDVVEVVAVQLARVMELVVVDQVAEPADRAVHLFGHRLVPLVRLVAAGHETRDHRSERPDPERCPHELPPRQRMTRRSPRTSNVSHAAGRTNASPGRTGSPASSPSPASTSSTPNRPPGSASSSTEKNSFGGSPSVGSNGSRRSASSAMSQPSPRCASSGEIGYPVHSQTIEKSLGSCSSTVSAPAPIACGTPAGTKTTSPARTRR